MSSDEERIRKMQADGKITKDQAEMLLKALPGRGAADQKKATTVPLRNVLMIFIALLMIAGAIGSVIFISSKAAHPKGPSTYRAALPGMPTSSHIDNPPDMEQPQTSYDAPRSDLKSRLAEIPRDYVVSQGEMLMSQGGKKLALPLKHTDVVGRIDGYLARVLVTQKFINPIDTTIEAIYTFPLPENAAVDSMIMTIGDRRIKGVIKQRGEARAIYEQARREGKTASLLEQERPNIFTQSIANIFKGDTILVTIGYVQELKYKNNRYAFVFPMVVGPRYIPGSPQRPSEHGTEPATGQVPDADRITPPLAPPGYRSGHDISLRLTINAGADISEMTSLSHKIRDVANKDKTRSIEILAGDNIPNKDFILEYTVAQKEISSYVLCHRIKDDGFFQLVIAPKLSIDETDIFERELVFVVDNSGSMMGFPIQKCKEIIALCLKNMRKHDVFRVMKFSGSTEELSPDPLAASSKNIARALSYASDMRGGGGTEMMAAIRAIFDAPTAQGLRKLVFFLTDGYVGNESAILATIRDKLGSARVFGCGVGSSPNRYLIEGMAYNGRGVSMFIRQDGEAKKAMEEFYSYIDAPVLTDIQLNFNGIEITQTAPRYLPDLFAGQPLAVIGRYEKPGVGNLTIKGKLPKGKVYSASLDVALPQEEQGNGVLATLWARKKIAEIELLGSRMMGYNAYTPDSVKEQVTRLGLTYKIMTSFTSFVAVDDAIRNKSGKWIAKEQAADLPEGVSPASQPQYRYANQKGALGIISGNPFGPAGFASDMDDKLGGVGGVAGSGGVGRREVVGIGYGAGYDGYGAGFGGGADMTGGVPAKVPRGSLKLCEPQFIKGGALTGGRSKASVMRVVMQNLASLRYSYNQRLRIKPDFKGKLVIKFAIDWEGKITLCEVVESSMKDPEFEKIIVEKIKKWVFEKIDKKLDVTEVIYPFVFSK